jgi:nucleoside-diphosphate kinase
MQNERTLVIIKPDAVQRNLAATISSLLRNEKNLRVISEDMTTLSREEVEKHYSEHRGKDFFNDLVDFMVSGPTVMMILEGPDAIQRIRKRIGATNPSQAEPGTIRKTYGNPGAPIRENLIHASDSPESAEREIKIFFEDLDD